MILKIEIVFQRGVYWIIATFLSGVTAVKTVVVDTGEAVGSAAVSGVTAVGKLSTQLFFTPQ